MANQRYLHKQDLVIDTFILDAPVEIEKGALLLDTQNDSVILELKITPLVENSEQINSITIKIWAIDDAGAEIEGYYPYLHTIEAVNAHEKKSILKQTTIAQIPDVGHVEVEVEQVAFLDGSIWQNSGLNVNRHQQMPIRDLCIEYQVQIQRDIEKTSPQGARQIKFLPVQLDQCWFCACGRPNPNHAEQCCRCGLSKSWAFDHLNEEAIQKNLEKYLENIKHAEAQKQKQAQEKKAAAQKRGRRIFLYSLLLVGVGLLIFVMINFLFPFIQYTRASAQLNRNEFARAIDSFTALGDYRDSIRMVDEARYRQATDLLDKGEFDEAITIFSSLKHFKDSQEMLKETNYQKAGSLLADGQTDEALELYLTLFDYKDSATLISDIAYQKARGLFEEQNYLEASNLLQYLQDYKDSKALFNEANYQLALIHLFEKDYPEAIQRLMLLDDYRDGDHLFSEAHYLLGRQLTEKQNWEGAIKAFEAVDPDHFPEAADQLSNARYQWAQEFAAAGDYETAYDLMLDLDYEDSAALAEEYAKIAFAWHVEGSLTKETYDSSERFTLEFTLLGGRPDEITTIDVICTTPNWTTTQTIELIGHEDAYKVEFWYIDPLTAIEGVGTITVVVAPTEEVLTSYEFYITLAE